MAIADRNRCKRYLNIAAKTTAKDKLIDELLASMKAMIETFLAQLSREHETATGSATWPAIRSLRRSNDIGSSSASATVTVHSLTSLQAHPEWSTRLEPAINQDIVDGVAHLYRNRSPNASSESAGGGISEGWDDVGLSGLPKRVERRLRGLISTIEA
jgi:hypothetical protein